VSAAFRAALLIGQAAERANRSRLQVDREDDR
jgi:hypothetical protein